MHVPGWHESTRALREAGRVRTLGIVQEQHPDRARLFMQWKRMEWPILVDSYNRLEVPYVPITLFVDEHGIVRAVQPPREDPSRLTAFLEAEFEPPGPPDLEAGSARPAITPPEGSPSGATWRAHGDALATAADPGKLEGAIAAYERAARLDPTDPWARFRLGVAYRMRFDSPARAPGDFQRAVDAWTAALGLDPNQYIFRRRIQQYGPRLDKPYPFYDWVPVARGEIEARGEAPVPLGVEPRGSEFARPAETFDADQAPEPEPDPHGRILRDGGVFVGAEATAVPGTVNPGASVRLHLELRPLDARKAHWNNEVDDLAVWIDPPPGWRVEDRLLTLPRPPQIVSRETRSLEVEVQAPGDATAGPTSIPAYALYYVCEDVDGICMYRRQDIDFQVTVRR